MKLITLTTALVAVGMLAGCTTQSISYVGNSSTVEQYTTTRHQLTVAHENGNNLCFLSHFTTNWDEYKKDLGELRKTIYEHQCDHIELYGWEFNPGVEFYWDNRGKKPVCSVALKAKNKGKDNPELIAERAAVSRSYESMAELNLPNCDSIDIRWQEAK
ncbi:hypothetical protein [Shewanella indica]|uniref:hypothetical protein n=1 Tax=Shewanella indica TaxID=768528 RepID=UPI000C31D460|nr:hypothetical protein [Shewanella indica]